MFSQYGTRYSQSIMAEKRKLARFEVSAPVRITLTEEDSTHPVEARTKDLSASGAYLLFSSSEVGVGSEMDIEIDFIVDPREHLDETPRDICVSGHGVVTRTEDEGFAVSFDGILKFV